MSGLWSLLFHGHCLYDASNGRSARHRFTGFRLDPAHLPELKETARKAGEHALGLAREELKPSDIMTIQAFENAIMVHAAIAGSSNSLLHLPAIAHELGIQLSPDLFGQDTS